MSSDSLSFKIPIRMKECHNIGCKNLHREVEQVRTENLTLLQNYSGKKCTMRIKSARQ